jgi:hypothetical protein
MIIFIYGFSDAIEFVLSFTHRFAMMQDNGEGESLEDLQMQFEELFLRPSASARSSKSSSSSKIRGARK